MKKRIVLGLLMVFLSSWSFGQVGVPGPVLIRLQDGGTDCSGYARRIEIWADVTGLAGSSGRPVGLNGFKGIITVDIHGLSGFFEPGGLPIPWDIVAVDETIVSDTFTVVGWSTDMDAPSADYHLATYIVTGIQTDVEFELQPGSQLASRLAVVGDGPELITTDIGPVLVASIPLTFDVDLGTAGSWWRETNGLYDFSAPMGPIDMLDLVRIIRCTP